MATKTRQRSRSKPAAAKAPPPEVARVDVLELDDTVEESYEKYTGWNSEYRKQKLLVADLQGKLDDAKAKLEIMAAPLRVFEAALAPEALSRIAAAQPYDAVLKTLVGQVTTSEQTYNRGKRGTKPTGAKAWAELRTTGASDAQIAKNLQHLKRRGDRVERYFIPHSGGALHRQDADFSQHTVLGKEKLVAEVRRVMEIPLPAKGAVSDKSVTTSPSRSRKKKPAAKSKSSAAAKTPAKSRSRSRKKTASPAADSPAEVASQDVNDSLTPPPTDDDVTLRAAGGNEKPPRRDIDFGEDDDAKCEVCGCDATNACEGGCYWIDHPSKDPTRWLCSQCVGKVKPEAKGKPGAGDGPARTKRSSRSRSKAKKQEPALAGS